MRATIRNDIHYTRMNIFWNEPLAEPVELKSGAKLHTLLDAAHFVEREFPGPVRAEVFDTYAALLQASRTGQVEDRQVATNALLAALLAEELV